MAQYRAFGEEFPCPRRHRARPRPGGRQRVYLRRGDRRRLEDELLGRRFRDVFCVYGLSMGGALALRMLADNRVHFQYAVIDGGITPYELPWLVTRFILLKDLVMTLLGRSSRRLLALAFPPAATRLRWWMRCSGFCGTCRCGAFGGLMTPPTTTPCPRPSPLWILASPIGTAARKSESGSIGLQYMARHISDVQFEEIPGRGPRRAGLHPPEGNLQTVLPAPPGRRKHDELKHYCY